MWWEWFFNFPSQLKFSQFSILESTKFPTHKSLKNIQTCAMAACVFHSKDKKRCPANCIFRDVFPQSDDNALKVRDFFKLEKLIDHAKFLSGIERKEDLVRSPEINAFLWEIYNFVQDIDTHSGGPYSRIEAVLKNLKAARGYLLEYPILVDSLLETSSQILEKQVKVYDCLDAVKEWKLELDREAQAEQEVAAEEAAEQEVAPEEAAGEEPETDVLPIQS